MILLKLVLLPVTVLYLAATLGLFAMQRQLQYFPGRLALSPSTVGLIDVQVRQLGTPDGETLVLWYVPASNGKPTILFFQGNAGEISDRAPRFAAYQKAGFGVAFLSYRGYGGSSGVTTQTGLITDAQTGYDWLIAQGTAPGDIAVVGESLGTGVAVQLAARNPVGALVLEAPFSSAVDVAALAYPWLPVRLLMKDQFRSVDQIGRVRAPLLILHGDRDRTVPLALGQALFAAAPQPKTFEILAGQGHEALSDPALWSREVGFIAALYPP